MEISTVPDVYHLKAHRDLPSSKSSRYVLFLPENDSTDGYLAIPNQLNSRRITSLMTGTLIDIVSYDPTTANHSYSFVDIPRHWYYTRIVSIQNNGSDANPIYTPSSPWSRHLVAGQQRIADRSGPSSDVRLERVRTDEVVAE